MFRKYYVALLITSLLLLPSIVLAAPPIPARTGGTVTVDGTQLTQATDTGYTFKVTKADGTAYVPAAEDTDGLNASDWFIIDIPIYDATDQPGGANPGDTAVIHVFKDSSELNITSPSNGEILIGSSGSTTQINIEASTNRNPVADAGPDQTVNVNDTVNLDGSGSTDPDGDTLTYQWSFSSRPAGSFASLSDTTAIFPSFAPDEIGDYVVQLIVNDGTTDSDPDTVTISTMNSKPIADAGPDQTVNVNNTVNLDGSGSTDADGDALTYQWSFLSLPAQSSTNLSNSNSLFCTFTPDEQGDYIIQLIVNDGAIDSDPDTITITAQRDNNGGGSDGGGFCYMEVLRY